MFSQQRGCGLEGVWADPWPVMFPGPPRGLAEPWARGCDCSERSSLSHVEFKFRQSEASYKPPLEQAWIFIVCLFVPL